MQVSKEFKLAVDFLGLLTPRPQNLQVLAPRLHTGEHFLAQIARKLRLAGLVESQRGPGGGYKLKSSLDANLDALTVYQALHPTARDTPYPTYIHPIEGAINRALSKVSVYALS